jgi:cobalamin synthase
MTGATDIILAIALVTTISLLARNTMATGKLPKWWWGIAIIPLLSVGLALAVTLFPRPIPDGWQEGDFDTGFADFIALVFFGVVLPIAYLAVALPVAFVMRLWKNRKSRPR